MKLSSATGTCEITVPIIPGMNVLRRKRLLNFIPSYFHVEIPEGLAAEVEEAAPEHAVDVGVEWAIRQSEELIEANVPC